LIDKGVKSPSQPDSQQDSQKDSQKDSQPDTLLKPPDDWRKNINLATQQQIADFNKTQAQTLDVPSDIVERLRFNRAKKEFKDQFKGFAERLEKKRLEQKQPLEPCFYGRSCYNKNEEHLAKYSHPTQDGSSGRGGGRRHQSKKSKRITVQCSPSSSFSLRTSTRTRSITRQTRRHRSSKRARKVSTRRR
jgi:hypothetical protein